MYMMSSGWQLRRISGPEIEPITLAEAKAAAKIDSDIVENDDLIEHTYIPAAREAVEAYLKRTLTDSTWQLTLADFPRDGGDYNRVNLPMPPVQAILGVSYLDNDGTRVELQSTGWLESLQDEPPFIGPPYGELWPNGRIQSGGVVIQYRAGYLGAGSPPDASAVPKSVKMVMKAIVTRWHENRMMTNVDDLLGAVHHLRIYP